MFARWLPDANEGTARFLLQGLAQAVPEAITSISCEGFSATWSAREFTTSNADKNRTLQVEMRLSSGEAALLKSTQMVRVQIALANGKSLEVPVYLVDQKQPS